MRTPEAPAAVRWITRTLETAGFETWAVGGAVRDALLGLDSADWDLATRARPAEVRRLFRRTVPLGIEHGTVGVLARDGTLYEVTTFRRDVLTTGRHAVVDFASTIEEDLSRRDFTINAIAWHATRRVIFDPFGGRDDLERLVLRTVGKPERRFEEDFLRVLRALRFAGRFGLEIEGRTWTALSDATPRLDVLSRERVRDELMKVLADDPRPARALELYRSSGTLGSVAPEVLAMSGVPLPGFAHAGLDALGLAVALADVVSQRRPLLRLAGLLMGLGLAPPGERAAADQDSWRSGEAAHRAAGLLLRLRFSNAQVALVTELVRAGLQTPRADAGGPALRGWLSRVGQAHVSDLTRLWVARERVLARFGADDPGATVAAWRSLRAELRRRPPLTLAELALDGGDLIRLGMKPGPRFAVVLSGLLDRVIADPLLNQTDTLAPLAIELWEREPAGPRRRG